MSGGSWRSTGPTYALAVTTASTPATSPVGFLAGSIARICNTGTSDVMLSFGKGAQTATFPGGGAGSTAPTVIETAFYDVAPTNQLFYDLGDAFFGDKNPMTVTAITQAATAVITINTVSGTHPLLAGQVIRLAGVVGMTQINGLVLTSTAIGGVSGAWTVTVSTDTTAFTAYASGGTMRRRLAGVFQAFSADTAAGDTLVAWGCGSLDGGSGNLRGSTMDGCYDTAGNTYVRRNQLIDNDSVRNFETDIWDATGATLPLKAVGWVGSGSWTAGDALGAVFTITATTSGVIRVNQRMNDTSFDSGKRIFLFTALLSGDGFTVGSTWKLSPSSAGLNSSGAHAMNSLEGIIQTWTPAGQSPWHNDYQGMCITHMGPCTFVGANGTLNFATGSGQDMTSGTAALGTGNVRIFGFSFNGLLQLNPFAPTVGTGFANWQARLPFDQAAPLCAFENQSFSNPGSAAALFKSNGTDDYGVSMSAYTTITGGGGTSAAGILSRAKTTTYTQIPDGADSFAAITGSGTSTIYVQRGEGTGP